MSRLKKALFISLVVVILATLGGIVYLIATPQADQKFTEFYLLDSQGKAESYPNQVIPDAEVEVTVGVVNHEYQIASYRVDMTINGDISETMDVGTLTHQQKWEQKVSFTAPATGEVKVEFWLYKDNGVEPYFQDPLTLNIKVMPSS